jgi:hypothetical protein
MTVSHNPTTDRQPVVRGAQGHGQKRVDLNAPKQAPAIKTRRKRA